MRQKMIIDEFLRVSLIIRTIEFWRTMQQLCNILINSIITSFDKNKSFHFIDNNIFRSNISRLVSKMFLFFILESDKPTDG